MGSDMTVEQLATQLAEATDLDLEVVTEALESGDPDVLELAEAIVDLETTQDEWHTNMARHRAALAI